MAIHESHAASLDSCFEEAEIVFVSASSRLSLSCVVMAGCFWLPCLESRLSEVSLAVCGGALPEHTNHTDACYLS